MGHLAVPAGRRDSVSERPLARPGAALASPPNPPRRSRIAIPIVCAALVSLLIPGSLEASRVRALNLEEMTQRASRVFAGRVTDLRVERDPRLGIEVTVVTLAVERAAKGQVEGRVSFKALGRLDAADPRSAGVAGMPRYRRGEEVVLFLYTESDLGLTSPVGLGQGKFILTKDKQGRRLAINEFGNQTLFRGLSADAARRLGPGTREWGKNRGIPSDALLNMVETLR